MGGPGAWVARGPGAWGRPGAWGPGGARRGLGAAGGHGRGARGATHATTPSPAGGIATLEPRHADDTPSNSS